MVVVIAFLIFLSISTVIWLVGVALYQSWLGAADVTRSMAYWPATLSGVGLATLLSLVPFPWGYWLTLVAWWVTVQFILGLSVKRASLLFLILGALSFVGRLAVLGALGMF